MKKVKVLQICSHEFQNMSNLYSRDLKDHAVTRESLVRLERGDRRVIVASPVCRVFPDPL